jgi:anti-anti-sigma factor
MSAMNSHPASWLRRALAALHLTEPHSGTGEPSRAADETVKPTPSAPIRRVGLTRSLAWCGEIINANADDVWRMTSEHVAAFAANHATLIIVDLTRLRFIDSTGATLMARLKKWGRERRVEILFVHPAPKVRSVLRLTQLEHPVLEGGQ